MIVPCFEIHCSTQRNNRRRKNVYTATIRKYVPRECIQKVFFKASEEIGCTVAASFRKKTLIRNTYNMVLQISIKTTNQSSRETAITAMDEAGLEARHIIRASGRKNEASV